MIDRTSRSKKAKHKGVVAMEGDVKSAPELSRERELSAIEESLMWANPTPEETEAFHEYLRKNGSGPGDP